MTNVARLAQAIFWGVILLAISPNKVAAVSYAILILGLLIILMIVLGIGRVIISFIKWVTGRLL